MTTYWICAGIFMLICWIFEKGGKVNEPDNVKRERIVGYDHE